MKPHTSFTASVFILLCACSPIEQAPIRHHKPSDTVSISPSQSWKEKFDLLVARKESETMVDRHIIGKSANKKKLLNQTGNRKTILYKLEGDNNITAFYHYGKLERYTMN